MHPKTVQKTYGLIRRNWYNGLISKTQYNDAVLAVLLADALDKER